MKKVLLIVTTVIMAYVLSGCAATTLIEKRNLAVKTKMAGSVFLDPVSPKEQIVYVRVRNTTDKDINIDKAIKTEFTQKGFIITNDPKKANFMVQANLLYAEKNTAAEARAALNSTFGGAIIAGGVAASTGGNYRDTGKAALVGAALGFLGNALVKDVYYTMVTDIEIRQRPLEGEKVTQNSKLSASQGISGTENQSVVSSNVQWKKYRTRIISTANKVNLEFKEAKSKLVSGVVRSISGIL